MHFNRKKFERFVNSHGGELYHYKATICPCIREDGNAKQNCTNCNTWGAKWDSTPTTVLANLTTNIPKNQFVDYGMLQPGSVYATFQKEVELSFMDKFKFVDTTNLIPVYTILEKGLIKPNGVTGEKVAFDEIVEVDNLIDDTTTYVEDTDFEIVNDNEISWLGGGSEPTDGDNYTIKYKTIPTYLIYTEMPKQRNENQRGMPIYCVLTRIDMIKPMS